jgi:hypothetical protein
MQSNVPVGFFLSASVYSSERPECCVLRDGWIVDLNMFLCAP